MCSYTGSGNRVYDAENRMTSAQDNTGVWAYYTYNADGQLTRRKSSNQETWQVYGFEGELLAEYPVNGPVASPQKEYGYRNGQVFIYRRTTSTGGTELIPMCLVRPLRRESRMGEVANESASNILLRFQGLTLTRDSTVQSGVMRSPMNMDRELRR